MQVLLLFLTEEVTARLELLLAVDHYLAAETLYSVVEVFSREDNSRTGS